MSEIHELRINRKKKKNNSQSQIEQIDNYKFIRNIIQLHFSLDTPSKRSCLTNLSDYYRPSPMAPHYHHHHQIQSGHSMN